MEQSILLNGQVLTYTLIRKKVKNINLRIKNGKIFVSAAKSVPLSVIEDFMQKKASWILSALERCPQKIPSSEQGVYLCGVQIDLPSNINYDAWQKEQAAHLLPAAYEQAWSLFQEEGFAKPTLRLRKMKSRWGSCIPSKSVITLNTVLIGAPVDCQIAVAVHELCHMLYPDHSKAFYTSLYHHFPDYERCKNYLKLAQSFLLDS